MLELILYQPMKTNTKSNEETYIMRRELCNLILFMPVALLYEDLTTKGNYLPKHVIQENVFLSPKLPMIIMKYITEQNSISFKIFSKMCK